jgi:Glycogen recognition site of AMP-activated protein kinase
MNVLVPVTFRFPAHLALKAQAVSVVGSFNGWNSTAHPLRRAGNGDWMITIYLSPGRVVYMFWADGVMWLDPDDEGRIPNTWGSEYSLRQVTSVISDGDGDASRLTVQRSPARQGERVSAA